MAGRSVIPHDLRLLLVEKLADLPMLSQGDLGSRTALLAGVPHSGSLNRNHNNVRGDLLLIVSQLEQTYDRGGGWHLLGVVDNAAAGVEGTELGRALTEIRAQLVLLDNGLRAARPQPYEVAQIHLLDLVGPVLSGVGLLPGAPATSGFALFTPSSRMLRCFCESLKHHSSLLRWSRDQVTTMGVPLVVDPVSTPVDVVLEKLAKLGPLLARQHVIVPAYTAEPEAAAEIWKRIDRGLAADGRHHLVIAFGLPAGSPVPDGVIALPEPRFAIADVRKWVDDIGSSMPWDQNLVERWRKVVLGEFAAFDHDRLPVDLVYDRLDAHCGLVQLNRTPEELLNALEMHEAMDWSAR
ncbi:hypothetical protein [Actinoplanes sp. NPDC049118]|uniref:hypothetical protein n=1 Tax=Actinoplanes sp. NPDC049118 TaxID=3155769 RepID=UPI00340DB698